MKLWIRVLVVLCTLPLSATATAGPYNFVKIVDTGGAFQQLSEPVINNGGLIAFKGYLRASGEGVFTTNGGSIGTIANEDVNGPFLSFGSFLSVNDAGTVAFLAQLRGGYDQAIVAGSPGNLTTIADTRGAFSSFSLGGINSSGAVAFKAGLDAGGQGIFTKADGVVTTVADTTGRFVAFGNRPSINDAGNVAFHASLDLYGAGGVYEAEGGLLNTIAETGGVISFVGSDPRIDNNGDIAFLANLSTGGRAAFLGSDGTLTSVVDTSGPFRVLGLPAFNRQGTMVFDAVLYEGEKIGIFTGTNPALDKLVMVGDPLDGSTITGLGFGGGLNDSGQVAFWARLADGREAIFRADPVPEPAALSLLLSGALLLALFRVSRASERR